ncbi:MAG TPA: PD-(D/E)XK nuclease family protein [Mariprofundaceae bacterium]|nr:PD-(D/E)XK nuclease family protein [Mariprofundaceae bacterium]
MKPEIKSQSIDVATDGVLDEAAVADALGSGAVLLCGTSPLAADWKRRLISMLPDGVAETPAVECWTQWLSNLACVQEDIPVPLSKLQELQLWERVIDDDMKASSGPASARGLARHASHAYRLLQEYRIDEGSLAGASEECEALARWNEGMRQALKREGRSLLADLPAQLLSRPQTLPCKRHILLDGFPRFTPMQEALIEAMAGQGARLHIVASANVPAEAELTACSDAESEYMHAAEQVAAVLATDEHARIAVVISRQVKDLVPLGRAFDAALLEKDASLPSMQAVNMPGMPLADQPMVCHLLALLGLAGRKGALLTDLAPLLFSPGIQGFATERMFRAKFDARLREENRYYIGFGSLLNQPEMKEMPKLAGVIGLLSDWDAAARPANEWVKSVHTLLQDIGFLQATAPERSSSEIRQLNAFRESLTSLVAVDAIHGKLEWGAFLSLLSSECRQALFAQPVRYPQVSVMPLEQITGLRFDHIFAVGFDEDALPLPAQPSPLLPFAVQRRYALPCATPALAFEESIFLWQQLRLAAPRLHISFAHSREERELNVSPLLAGMAAVSREAMLEVPEALVTENYDDAPIVPLDSDEAVGGGSDIIRNQSACPFRAFARHRLALAPLGETRPGIEPREKGSLIHHALQYIWEELQSQQALLAIDEAALAALVEAAIDHAWGKVRKPVSEATRHYERLRMAAVLQEWLGEERNRPAFTVERCEKPYKLLLPSDGGMQFTVKLKADRIDRDGDGRKILIDYKSGQKQSAGKWVGKRMEQPQLPLYSMAEGLGADDAVCFARVRSGECGFEGLSGGDTGIKGVEPCDGKNKRPDDWPQLLDTWKESIDALAGEFVRGRSEVAPRNRAACEHCGLEAVCRIGEIGFEDASDDDEEQA